MTVALLTHPLFLLLCAGCFTAICAALVLYFRARQNAVEIEHLHSEVERLNDVTWELKESEERFRDLVANQGDVILRKDLKGALTFVNQVFCDTFELNRNEALGKTFIPLLPEGDTPRMLGSFTGLSLPPYRVRYDQRIVTARGPRWFVWEEFAIRDDEGHLSEIQTVGRDITDRKETEERLGDALERAQAANRSKGQFLATMSHEIRTPMNGVLGMIGFLLDTELTPAQKSHARAVQRSGEALLTIINDILDFSKIESGKFNLTAAPFDIGTLIEQACELMAASAFEKNIDIAGHVSASVPTVLVGDESRLRQILINLIGNAVKFTERGGVFVSVDLDTDQSSDISSTLVITVEDTGIGLSESACEEIFAEFAQAEQGHARRFGGTGLGLSITRRLAQAMGGDVSVSSKEGVGSSFSVTLQLPARPDDTQRLPISLEGRKAHVSVEAPMTARAVAAMLREMGAVVTTSHDCLPGSDLIVTEVGPGLERFANHSADIFLLTVPGAILPERSEHQFAGYLVRPVRTTSFVRHLTATPEERRTRQLEDACKTEAIASKDTDDHPFTDTSPEPESEPTTGALQVLVAEDNELNATLTRMMVERAGHVPTMVESGVEALAALEEAAPGTFDVVFMDLHMPLMDGYEATRRIRALDPSKGALPIVALTANVMAEDRKACMEAGMDDYLSKPVDPADLAAMLETWRGKRSQNAA